jgi:hypothetical protein
MACHQAQDQAIWEKYPYEIALLALWKMGQAIGLSDKVLAPFRVILKTNTPFFPLEV